MARTRPIHAIIIRGASDKEPFAVDLGRRLLAERLANQTDRVRDFLGDDLRPGLSITEAAERYCALASPDLYHVVIAGLGWSAAQHRSWLTALVHADLLGSPPPRPADGTRPARRTRRRR